MSKSLRAWMQIEPGLMISASASQRIVTVEIGADDADLVSRRSIRSGCSTERGSSSSFDDALDKSELFFEHALLDLEFHISLLLELVSSVKLLSDIIHRSLLDPLLLITKKNKIIFIILVVVIVACGNVENPPNLLLNMHFSVHSRLWKTCGKLCKVTCRKTFAADFSTCFPQAVYPCLRKSGKILFK